LSLLRPRTVQAGTVTTGGSRHEPAPSAAGVDVTPVDDILTSDPGDLRVLAEAADVHVELILV